MVRSKGENRRRSYGAWSGAAKVVGGLVAVAGGVALFGVTGGIAGIVGAAAYTGYRVLKSRRDRADA